MIFSWGDAPPDTVQQKPLHSVKVTVWAAMSSSSVIGPFFYEDERGQAVTVNTERYLSVLEKFYRHLRNHGYDVANTWFQ